MNNDDEDDDIVHQFIFEPNPNGLVPVYMGGFTIGQYAHSFTGPDHVSAAHVFEGNQQLDVYGQGYHVNPMNTYYSCSGVYDPTWIVPLLFEQNKLGWATRNTGWCRGCGYYLVNPNLAPIPMNMNQENGRTWYYYANIASGADNYANYFHYPCAKSHFSCYDKMRYQASLCLFYPNVLRWGVSSNQGHHKDQHSFTYCETIDLFVGMKLAGYLKFDNDGNLIPHPGRIRWKVIRTYCFILRLINKSTEQMRWKYREYIKDGRFKRYFTQEFFDTTIFIGVIQPVPQALIPY
jgi:hypothetical protein